jgi:hypothetical protein
MGGKWIQAATAKMKKKGTLGKFGKEEGRCGEERSRLCRKHEEDLAEEEEEVTDEADRLIAELDNEYETREVLEGFRVKVVEQEEDPNPFGKSYGT